MDWDYRPGCSVQNTVLLLWVRSHFGGSCSGMIAAQATNKEYCMVPCFDAPPPWSSRMKRLRVEMFLLLLGGGGCCCSCCWLILDLCEMMILGWSMWTCTHMHTYTQYYLDAVRCLLEWPCWNKGGGWEQWLRRRESAVVDLRRGPICEDMESLDQGCVTGNIKTKRILETIKDFREAWVWIFLTQCFEAGGDVDLFCEFLSQQCTSTWWKSYQVALSASKLGLRPSFFDFAGHGELCAKTF